MKIKIKKIISITVAAGFIFLWSATWPALQPGVLVLAEETTPDPNPTPEPTPEAIPESTPEPSPTPAPDTIIQTGSADSNLNINNNANSNIFNTSPETPEIASNSNSIIPNFIFSPQATVSGEIENLISENLNLAGLDNTATSSAGTGQNEAVANDENADAIVVSGDATAQANVVNIANSNIIDSNGFFLLFNIFTEYFGDLDFSSWGNFEPNSCPSDCQMIEDLTVNNVNTATVSNDIYVGASTGENIASSSQGDALILTGDAKAGANVVNIVNTNIIGSNYLLIGINNFGDWIGNLIMPDKTFFENLFGLNSSQNIDGDDISISNQNQVTLENNAGSSADSGGNLSQGGNAIISTGQSQANTNIANFINQNIYDSGNLFILIKVHGQWTGNIYGLPQGATWQEQDGQIIVQGSGGNDSEEQSTQTNQNSGYDDVVISNTNNAIIKNNVNVFALTGGNKVISLNGNANILSGNAQAGANILNLVNTNIIGRNWVFALINIFGNWKGNLSFGQPDLFVGGNVKVNSQDNDFTRHDPKLGDSLNYEFTIINRGDVPATDVWFKSQYNEMQEIHDSGTGSANGNQLEWYLGTLTPGESKTVDYRAGVNYNNPPGYSILTTIAYAAGNETDANLQDNTEIISFRAYRQEQSNGPVTPTSQGQPKLVITKTNDSNGNIEPKEQVKFIIKLINQGDASALDVVVKDKLLDGFGEMVHEESWILGEVFAGEEIIMDYTIEINGNAQTGRYTNTVSAEGINSAGYSIETARASSSFHFFIPNQSNAESASSNSNANIQDNDSDDLNSSAAEETIEIEKTIGSVLKPFGQEAEAKEQANGNINNDDISNPRKDLFGSLLLSMFGFLNDLPPIVLALSALAILALILLALKKRRQEKDNPSDEESV
jgi:hypothetical protein